MGLGGTEVTRQSADIILSDDNFSTIVLSVGEGRRIYDNIVKFLGRDTRMDSREMEREREWGCPCRQCSSRLSDSSLPIDGDG